MSNLQYYSYAGIGEKHRAQFRYSQAVRIGDRLECAGQGGWDPQTGAYNPDLNAQIDQAFANVDLILKTAGSKGWSQVFRIHSYHVNLSNEHLGAMVGNFAKWMPDHQPLWTVVGVAKLAEEGMQVEIEDVALDPQS